MIIQFTVQDLLMFLGFTLLAIIGILLILILWKANKVMGTFRALIDSNRVGLQKSIGSLPVIIENAEQISQSMKITTDQLSLSAPAILKDAEFISGAAKDGVKTASAAIVNVSTGVSDTVDAIRLDVSEFSDYFHIGAEIIKIIMHAFSSKK